MSAFDLIIGFDTEYVSALAGEGDNVRKADVDALAAGNKVLCISYAVTNPDTGQKFSGVVDIPPTRNRRWTLKQFIERVLDTVIDQNMIDPEVLNGAKLKGRKKRHIRIGLVAHFTRADLPGFADFKKLKKKFDGVRGTYVTIANPLIIKCRLSKHRPSVSITMRDTMLLAPAGKGKLEALGEMLAKDSGRDLEKLSVPDVTDENGTTVSGITRMDIVQREHPEAFARYAIRDAEVAVDYFERVAQFAAEWGILKSPATLGALGVNKYLGGVPSGLFQGYVPDPESKGRGVMMHPNLNTYAGLWANGFMGGRNEAFAHGEFTAPKGREWNDIDVASAYTAVMGGIPTLDWADPILCTDLNTLCTLDHISVARIDFKFPEATKLPCLPVRAGSGLIFPLEGRTTVCGPELILARQMGAEIKVETGMVFKSDPSPDYNYASFTAEVNAARAAYKADGNEIFEALIKEVGNSLYGKVAQAVAGMRTENPDTTTMFDTRTGGRQTLPPSKITNPVHAAFITSMLRGVVSEIMAGLPDRQILSVTTDGFLTDATLEEAYRASNGTLATWFQKVLAQVAPEKPFLEVKHRADTVIILRTRGAFTVSPTAPRNKKDKPILAQAGHKLEAASGNDWTDAQTFIKMFYTRTPDTTLLGRDLVDIQTQWMADADLISTASEKRVNFDYDFGACPIGVTEVKGCLNFTTRPWANSVEYQNARAAHSKLRQDGGQLKTMRDWLQIADTVVPVARMAATNLEITELKELRGYLASNLSEIENTTYRDIAEFMTAIGLPTTREQSKTAGKYYRKTLQGVCWTPLISPSSFSKVVSFQNQNIVSFISNNLPARARRGCNPINGGRGTTPPPSPPPHPDTTTTTAEEVAPFTQTPAQTAEIINFTRTRRG